MEAGAQTEVQDRLKKLVDRIQGLPTLPAMLNNINKMMLNPRTSAKEVAQLISSDPSITSKVLRVVNSSFYGFPNRITTVTHAIVILGFNTIKSIVLSSTIFDVFRKEVRGGFDRQEFWKHSIGCGAAAKVLARRLGFPTLEEIFIAGLLHDVGKIVMDQFLHERFAEVLDMVRTRNCLIVEAEEKTLGITHSDVGAWLFEKWNLSKGLVETTRCHHNPALAGENAKPAAIIHFADILVRALRFGSGGDQKIPQVSDAAWSQLGLDPGQFDPLLAEVGEEIERAMIFLDFIK
ncbi:MAG: HDOD domain-containing protein [Planctomycetes bacterium]|nr:HDOD domain-containing protein [Planctomycetota bacterium]